MIAWGNYFHFNAEDVKYIEAIDSTSGEYPYRLTVHLKSGNAPSVYYKDSKSRDTARNELVRLVDRVRHEDTEKILNQLTLLNYSNERIERRQLRIWRHLRDLLNLKIEEVSTNV